MDTLLLFALAIPVVLLTGIAKGGFAGGLGTLAVPLLSLLLDPRQAAAIMLPVLCCMDAVAVWEYRKSWDKRNLVILIPAAIVGIVVGTATFRYLNGDMIRLIVGVLAIYFFADYWFLRRRPAQLKPKGPNVISGGFWGAIGGFTSFIAHAGGPPLSIYLLPQKMETRLLVGTSVVLFFAINYVKLIPYAWLGQLSTSNLFISLILLPFAPIGIKLGVWLHSRVSEKLFYIICYWLLFLAGIKLSYEGGMALLM